MKKLITISALLAFSLNATAQMTLEHSYTSDAQIQYVVIEDMGGKYIALDTQKAHVNIYNLDHSLNVSIPVEPNAVGVYCASTKFFNSDNSIEVLVSYYNPNTQAYQAKILNESGAILQTLPGIYYASPIKTDNGWKLLAGQVVGNFARVYTSVYSVPGSMPTTAIPHTETNDNSSVLYPNPMDNAATLRYSLPSDSHTGTIQVFNSAGQIVRSFNVTDAFNDVLIQRNELTAGTYYYTIIANGQKVNSASFVIK